MAETESAKSTVTPLLTLGGQNVKSVNQYKYLRIVLDAELSDDKDIPRQLQYQYCAANKLRASFSRCSNAVKNVLFRSFWTPMNASQLSRNFRKSCMQRLRVAYNFGCRALYNLPWRASVSRGVTMGGMGSTIPRAPNYYGAPEKSQQCHKYILQYSKFASEIPHVRTWGRQTCPGFLSRAPSNLVTPLSVSSHEVQNVTFLPLRLCYEKTRTCFSKDAENLTTCGYVLWCSVCIRPYSLNTTIAFYSVKECPNIAKSVRLMACHVTMHSRFAWTRAVLWTGALLRSSVVTSVTC